MSLDRLNDGQGRAFEAWLRHAPPDDLHECATSWNWDNGTSILRRIIERADCEQATALHVFWHGEPSHYAATYKRRSEVETKSNYDLGIYDLLAGILQRWRAGVYRGDSIAFDPASAYAAPNDITNTAGHAELSIPKSMLDPVGRRPAQPSEDFDEGIPFSILGWAPLDRANMPKQSKGRPGQV